MENYNDEMLRTSQLEPEVLIEDGEEYVNQGKNCNSDCMQSIGPDISLIPLKKKKKHHFKIRLFDNTESERSSNSDIESSKKLREPVRIISKEEAELAPEPYQKRKSLPLEKCPICKKFFRRMSTHLLKHEFSNLNGSSQINALTCHFCNKIFNTHSNLLIHVRSHTGQKPYICDVCHKSFSQSCNLVNHRRIHSGEKPFKCPHCDKAFTQSGNLNNHIRLHTNEKPFQCHFCDKAFVQSGNLNSHIKNNHRLNNQIFHNGEIGTGLSDRIVNISGMVN